MDEAKLKRDLNNLAEMRSKVLNEIFQDHDETDFNQLVYEYGALKAEILLKLTAPYKVPQIADPALRCELKTFLKDGDAFITNLKRDGFNKETIKSFEKLLQPQFEDERLEEIAQDLFLVWFNQYDYVYGLLDTATIIIKNIDFPDKLHSLINEVRQCVVFQNYLAAGIMLRTITEVAVNDILQKNFESLDEYDLSEKLAYLKEEPGFTMPASILDAYRRDLNKYVHGERIMSKDQLQGYLEIVLDQIQELYEVSE